MIKFNMDTFLLMFVVGFNVFRSEGSVTLTVPTAGNCEDDTVLICHVTDIIGSTGWYGLNRALITNGAIVRPEDSNKYTETRGSTSYTLTIHNTDITDQGEYKCENGFDQSQLVRLSVECKASSAVHSVTNGKKITITVDKLYPSPTFSTSFRKETTVVNILGSRTCTSSTWYSGYYRCVWSSSNSLADGSYTFSIVVTTITQADPITGSFKIVPPRLPDIADTVTLNSSYMVLYENEEQSLTIQCTSIGGYPIPTVVWYKESVSSSNQLASTSTGTLQSDGTYTVTLQHTFTPTLADDKMTMICRSYYPQADSAFKGSKTTSVILYLRLKPSDPTVIQTTAVTAGGTIEVRCATTGSRPAANITWSYQGATYKGTLTSTLNKVTETYTVVSVYRRQVTAADNGHNIQCVVTHPALVSPSEIESSVVINVQFKSLNTTLTGNSSIIANGQNALSLVCTSGSSNPISSITWRINEIITPSTSNMSDQSGQYGGMIRQRGLTLRPTRDNDGDIVSCEAKNDLGTSERSETTLNLKYRPLIEPMQNQVTVEGNVTVLSCKASSKPASTLRWYRQGQNDVIHEGTGTLDKNQLSYTISYTRRTHAGTFRCEADNGIEMADAKSVSLIVNYPPDVTVLTKNTTVKHKTVQIKCSASGVPDNQYKYGKWIQKWPEPDVTVKEYNGSPHLVLDSLTYEHSGVYSCSASNGIKVFGTNREYMEGSEQLLVKSYPVILNVNEKVYGRLKENVTVQIDYYSNVEQSTVKCHKIKNGSRQSAFVVAERYDDIKVNLPVFSSNIIADGIRAFVTVRMNSKEDFGFYDLVVTNNIDAIFRTVEIIPGDPPSPPNNFQLLPVCKTPTFIWEESYDGGKPEKFIIQTSHSDTKQWINHTNETELQYKMNDLFYTAEIKLQPGTYMARILSSNAIGDSETTNLGYTFEIKEDQKPSSLENSCSCTAVGSSLGVICVIMAIYAGTVTFIWRRSLSVKGAQKLEEKVDQKMTYVNLTFKSGSTGVDALQQEYSEETQYTSLERESRDDKATYDVLHAK